MISRRKQYGTSREKACQRIKKQSLGGRKRLGTAVVTKVAGEEHQIDAQCAVLLGNVSQQRLNNPLLVLADLCWSVEV